MVKVGAIYRKPTDEKYPALLDMPIRIITVVEGYAVARRKGCPPFVVNLMDTEDWKLIPRKQEPL